MIKKTALLFGGTGLVGKQLLEALIKDDNYEKICLFTRKSAHSGSSKVEEIITDFNKLSLVAERLMGDDLYCCIGTTIKKAGTRDQFRQVDYGIPVALAEMASRNNLKHFVVISSIGADARSNNFYLRTKGEMEQALLRLLSSKLIIVRPSLLLGDRNEFRFGEAAGKGIAGLLAPLFRGSLARYRPIHARRVAAAMIYLALHRNEKGIVESDELYTISKLYLS